MTGRCNSGLDELDQLEVQEKQGPYPLECCGKIPSECKCLEQDEARRVGVAPIRVSLEMLEDSKIDLAAACHWAAVHADRQVHKSTLDTFKGI